MKGFMRHLTSLLLVVLLVAASAGAISWWFWQTRTDWPHFPSDVTRGQAPTAEQLAAAKSPSPEVVVKVDRDYAYRIGDIVPATIYLRQKAGTEIDLHSIAIDGDFEIAGNPTFFVRHTADGGAVIRVDIKLQSFSAVPKWTMNANMSYRVIATNDDVTITLPALEVYTSNTWDQRDRIEEGHLRSNFGFEPFFTAALLIGGLFGAIYCNRLRKRYKLEHPSFYDPKTLPSRFHLARRDFNVLWAKMEAGDRSADRYAELSQLMRRLYRIETKTTLEAAYHLRYTYNGPREVIEILKSCDKVIYRNQTLSDYEHNRIKTTFDQIVAPYPEALLAKLPPTKVVNRSADLKLTRRTLIDPDLDQ